jgi:uncharacterized membrane protein YdbT with pleckstrin-like domain
MKISELSGLAKRYFELVEFDQDEELICEIRKHPFGLFLVYATGFFISLAIIIISALVLFAFANDPLEVGSTNNSIRTITLIVALIMVVLTLGATAIGAYLYRSNIIFVTSEKLAQVLYISLFNRKISQLSLGDIQDVTVEQNGFLPRLFKYGTVVVETAGEQNNYIFTYTPDPYIVSKHIVGAHERNLAKYGN